MVVGSLGDIIFEVSSATIKTLQSINWNGSANIQTHTRHLDNSLTEFTGVSPDGFTFSIKLSKYLGVDPMIDIVKIFNYERSGTTLPLTIGLKPYGKYRWLIKSHKTKIEHTDGRGNITSATVDVTLTEYTKE